jgi:hypothetical protein
VIIDRETRKTKENASKPILTKMEVANGGWNASSHLLRFLK